LHTGGSEAEDDDGGAGLGVTDAEEDAVASVFGFAGDVGQGNEAPGAGVDDGLGGEEAAEGLRVDFAFVGVVGAGVEVGSPAAGVRES